MIFLSEKAKPGQLNYLKDPVVSDTMTIYEKTVKELIFNSHHQELHSGGGTTYTSLDKIFESPALCSQGNASPLYLCPTEVNMFCLSPKHYDAFGPTSCQKQVASGHLCLHDDDRATLTQKLTSVHREL